VRPSLRTPLAALTASFALLTACGGDIDSAADPQPPSATDTSTTSGTTLPDSYGYVLTSSCGERGLLGDYRVVVENAEVTAVENLNEDYPYDPELSEVPTLADLVDKARSAAPDALVELTLDESGLPRSLSLDPVPDAIDDEECYRVSDLEITSPSTEP